MKLIIRLMLILLTVFFINITVYAYTEYKVGDIVSYNGINYYVIKDSNSKETSVTMLKAEPLSYEEVQTYSNGTGAQIYGNNGYGGMQYHSSSSVYSNTYVKTTVDAWKNANAPAATEARLITIDDLKDNLGYEQGMINLSMQGYVPTSSTPSWVYNSNYYYWTMSSWNDSASNVWYVDYGGVLRGSRSVGNDFGVVRPVITLSKTSLGDTDESIVETTDNDDKDDKKQSENKSSDNKKETITKVKVENTYMSQTLIIMIIGFISICSGVVIYYLIKNKVISRR